MRHGMIGTHHTPPKFITAAEGAAASAAGTAALNVVAEGIRETLP
eukprot:CAMPEP_0202916038 /NCGR_PEP_ID=MMETSP1392-20130828/67472_1 /ASSEMBLY_ACC=CAM_ASM_000868 /TAXON_ID=225041 /ORGANISM="Chlamydomonas chlamydogama, Strain SAG 11-48b" /LENGTH=44 /DNA_ID= /DNA_START= /DNA_END= /DNA_ORIENTATION=